MARIKRMGIGGVFAFLAAIVFALAIAPNVAKADGPTDPYVTIGDNTLTVNNLEVGDKVTIYQVVKTSFNQTNNDVKHEFTVTAEDFPTIDEWMSASGSDPAKKAQAEELANKIAMYWNKHKDAFTVSDTAIAAKDGSVCSAKFDHVVSGQYLIIVNPATDSAARVFQNNIVSVMPTPNATSNWFDKVDAVVDLKSTVLPESGIKQRINGDLLNTDTIDAAKPASIKVESVVPRYTGNLETRLYKIEGKVSAGFSFNKDSIVIEVNDTAALKENYVLASTEDGFTLTVNNKGLEAYANQPITITYKATPRAYPDAHAPKYSAAETTNAKLTFSANSYDDDSSQSLKSLNEKKTVDANIVHATFYGVTFNKVSADEAAKLLSGAEFTVRNGTTVVGFGASGADGIIKIDGALAAGIEYTFEETKAPSGYKPVTFKATVQSKVKEDFSSDIVQLDPVKDPANDYAGDLPTTGGPGTIALTAAGVCLIAGAAVIIGRSRKRHE